MKNRPLKFRVFLPSQNKMWYNNFVISPTGKIGAISNEDIVSGQPIVANIAEYAQFSNAVVQQWTGLKDKNGKDIYEGDIVTVQTSDDPEDLSWELNTVEYRLGACCLSPAITFQEYLGDWADYDNGNCSSLEIVGNIFENPELSNKNG